MNIQVEQCVQLINESNNIAALTGAGISTSAGIPDFRGPKGLYVTRQYDPDLVFNIDHFYQDPKPFFEFARDFIGLTQNLQPTTTHQFLAKLEDQGKLKGIITQNIDCLHQKAGSKNVLEMHGGIGESYCLECQDRFDFEEMKNKLKEEEIPHCQCGGVIKPDIVFFGENVKCLNESAELAMQSDLFFVIGSSCVVYPAAMMPEYAQGKVVVVNMDEIQLNSNNIFMTVKEDLDAFFKKVLEKL